MTSKTSNPADFSSAPLSEAAPRRALPILVTALLAVAIWAAHLHLIPAGSYHFYDEFHTLDRATGFARHDNWFAVYSLQEVSFRKPPLQYWMTAGLLEAGIDLQYALRIPSMVFALGLLAATALLAAALLPMLPWAMPGAVLLVAGSTMLWEHALSAMLDMGAACFTTLSLAATIFALRRPQWWYVVAAAIVLGALQKAAIGLFLVGFLLLFLSLTRKYHGLGFRQIRAERAFRISTWIAILGTLAWPGMQSLLHDPSAFDELFGKQMFHRFTPADTPDEIRTIGDLDRLLIGGEPVLRWLGIAALAWLPWRLKRPELLPLPMLFAAYAVAMMLAGGHVTPRYTLNFLPLLSASLSCVIVSLFSRQWIALMPIAAISAASGGPVRTEAQLALGIGQNYREQIAALSRVGETLTPEERMVVCAASGSARIVPALASYFASNGRPFSRMVRPEKPPELPAGDGPIRGLCTPEDLESFAHHFAGVEILEELPPYVMWTAEGLR